MESQSSKNNILSHFDKCFIDWQGSYAKSYTEINESFYKNLEVNNSPTTILSQSLCQTNTNEISCMAPVGTVEANLIEHLKKTKTNWFVLHFETIPIILSPSHSSQTWNSVHCVKHHHSLPFTDSSFWVLKIVCSNLAATAVRLVGERDPNKCCHLCACLASCLSGCLGCVVPHK